jgi:hypothetical protein
MPLHYGKVFAFIALLTIAAFILWQVWVAFFAGETVEQPVTLDQGTRAVTVAAIPG